MFQRGARSQAMTNLELFKPPQEMRELNLLQELEKNPVISQRELSHKFGIALGLTNACLKRMARRGWIRIAGLNRRQIGYYLTARGFSEKAKLSLHLISWTVQHYASLKEIIGQRFLEMQQAGIETVVFYGMSDEMEIAYVTLQGVNLKLVGIVEDEKRMKPKEIFGFELRNLGEIDSMKPDGILITSLTNLDERMERLQRYVNLYKIRVWNISTP
jgi:hypothetical protein